MVVVDQAFLDDVEARFQAEASECFGALGTQNPAYLQKALTDIELVKTKGTPTEQRLTSEAKKAAVAEKAAALAEKKAAKEAKDKRAAAKVPAGAGREGGATGTRAHTKSTGRGELGCFAVVLNEYPRF